MATPAQMFTPEERREYIGASEIACVMGLDRYKTPLELYNEKLGLVSGFEGNRHTMRGNRLESIAAEEYEQLSGRELKSHAQPFVHSDYPFIVGHVDRTVVGEKRIVEIKCPSIAAFRRFQRDGLPESYIIQAQVYMGLAGYPRLTYAIFCADAWDLAAFDVAFDKDIYNAAIRAAANFWNNHILTQTPPEAGNADKPNIEFEKIGGNVTKRDDPVFTQAMADYFEADQIIRDAEELKAAAKEKVLDAIERQYGRYEGGGMRLYFTQQAGRKSFDKKALQSAHPTLDLSPFEKQGQPFDLFKTYQVTGDRS